MMGTKHTCVIRVACGCRSEGGVTWSQANRTGSGTFASAQAMQRKRDQKETSKGKGVYRRGGGLWAVDWMGAVSGL